MRELVYLQTQNLQKLEEYRRILGRHRISVEQTSPEINPEELVVSQVEGSRVKAVMREESNLYDPSTNKVVEQRPESLEDLLVVLNRTRLECWVMGPNGIERKDYSADIEGYIQPLATALTTFNPNIPVFGWDYRFVSKGTGLTYQEMRERGVKLSGRDQVLSRFTRDHLTFGKRRDFVALPQQPERTIDFRRRPVDFFRQNEWLNNPHIKKYGIQNLLHRALNLGPFFRAPNTRRENIYWCPGGNGGIPYTSKVDKSTGKPDAIHETTYCGAHDTLHHVLLPDLIYEGATDPLSIKIQTICRMMSESLTLVGADMLFVDTLVASGYEYDFSKRKIYPLFESLKRQNDFGHNPDALKQLFYANVRYALRGDDSRYRDLGADAVALEQYKGKYKAYFVEDFRWTEQNIKNMTEDAEKFRRWRQSIKPLAELKKYTAGCVTVSECVDELRKITNKSLEDCSSDELIDAVFEWVWKSTIEPSINETTVEVDDDQALKSGFLKYMMAQMYIFDVFDFIPESAQYRDRITSYLVTRIDTLTQNSIDVVRNFYVQYVRILREKGAITEEDEKMYGEIFPLFPPFYINYDADAKTYPELSNVSASILDRL